MDKFIKVTSINGDNVIINTNKVTEIYEQFEKNCIHIHFSDGTGLSVKETMDDFTNQLIK